MNANPLRRPTACLEALLRRTRHQRQQPPNSPPRQPQLLVPIRQSHAHGTHSSRHVLRPREVIHHSKIPGLYTYNRDRLTFAVHPPVPTVRSTHPDPLPGFKVSVIARLDPTGARTALFSKKRLDAARPGDILMVTQRKGEPFAGALMQIRRRGPDTAIQLRGQMMKTGVEMWYKIYSPEVVGIDIVWRRPKRARRARLTYLRKQKHDMGDVEKYVISWKREQRTLRSKGKAGSEDLGRRF